MLRHILIFLSKKKKNKVKNLGTIYGKLPPIHPTNLADMHESTSPL